MIGFCMGGGFALQMFPRRITLRFRRSTTARSPKTWRRHGHVPAPLWAVTEERPLSEGRNRETRESPWRHWRRSEIREYPQAGHSFMNDHQDVLGKLMCNISGAGHDAVSADAARRRIVAFFDSNLRG